ncbi:CHASE2 domain-containing protein [Nodosilinea sp. P-1105]|uniref:CHASE2 domain-containing protein n=1 Tax=Nodosilinea sp. P-1105 TaxID=2546229 RepID=UPI00146EA84F|nr:CHASE2 domain-containing protein [Nodosilinea sp. P-1105]NMF81766.1 CHASE2 domain-containing protein [Nodosilinea sp. P-1105]
MIKHWAQHLWRLLPGTIAAIAIALLLQGQAFQPLEQMAYRHLFELRGSMPLDERLAVIAIDDASLRELGRFPWPRHYYAQLLDRLTHQQASVVVITLLWSEPSDDDAQLAQALQRQGVTVLAQAWDTENTALVPVPELEQAAIAVGHIMRREDTDGIVRSLPPLWQGQPALALSAIQSYGLVSGQVTLPSVEQPLGLNWVGSATEFTPYSFVDVLEGRIPATALQDKIVVVGATAAGLDPLITPFDRNPPTSGVYLQATAIHNLLQNNALRPLGGPRLWLILLAIAPGLSWLMAGWNTPQQLVAMVGLCSSWGLLSLLLFQTDYWLPTAAPISLFIATAALVALSDRLREDYLLRRQVAHLWQNYHQDLLTHARTSGVNWESAAPLPRPQGAIPQVSQLADLAQQLGRSQAMQIAIARTLPVGLLAADSDGRIWFCNPVASQLFAIQVGNSMQSAVVPTWLSADQWQTSLEQLKTGNTSQYRGLHRDHRWFDLSLQPLPSCVSLNRPTVTFPSFGILLLLEEITEHKQAEAALRQAKEAALREAQRSAAASRAKGDFLAHMSHELRTPLNVILGFTQVMGHDQSLHLDHRNHLKIINRSGQHLLGLINDVLEMSKIESGRIQLNATRFDLHHLLRDLVTMVQAKAKAKGLELRLQTADDLPQYITADEGKLRQILLNLVGNAIKFTKAGSITLRVHQRHDLPPARAITLAFEVEDTGIGIATEALGQLFQPFTQVNASHQTEAGTGLGLAITHRFVRLMEGDITVQSTLGQGSLFKFHVQVAPAQAPLPPTDSPQGRVVALAANQPTCRILVVEDQWENSQLLAKLLTPLGFELRFAQDGKAGITLWQQWQPHLILMDLRMPVMDGVQATQAIRAIECDQANAQSSPHSLDQPSCGRTKIIALTASPFEETRANAIAIGCDDFLRKPVQTDLLLDKLAEHLSITYRHQSPLDAAKEANSSVNSDILSPQALATWLADMPPEWVQELHDLAVKGADRPILQLIAQLPSAYDPMIKTMTHWLDNFNFDKIIQITQSKR